MVDVHSVKSVRDVEFVLNCVRMMDYQIENLIDEQWRLRSLAEKITGTDWEGMPHGKGGVSDPVGRSVEKITELQVQISENVERLVEFKQKIIDYLSRLDAVEYQVLYLHYIRYMNWCDVAYELGYSTQQVHRYKLKGLKHFLNVVHDGVECHGQGLV